MRKKTLARTLRKKQLRLGEAPRALIEALSDDDIIESYVTCSNCGATPTPTQIRVALSQATSADHFFELCDFATHHPEHGTLRSVGDHPVSTTKDTTPPPDQPQLQALPPPSGEEPEDDSDDFDDGLEDYDDEDDEGPTYGDLVRSAMNSAEQVLWLLKETTQQRQERSPLGLSARDAVGRLEQVVLRYLDHITTDLEDMVALRDQNDAELEEEDEDTQPPPKNVLAP